MMTETTPASAVVESPQSEGPKVNPWSVVPLLYFMQAVPTLLVQDISGTVYKSLGFDNVAITKWTALVAIPWSLQMLLGPIVDLNSTKRKWTLTGQMIIAICLMAVPFIFQLPHAFELSLGVFFVTAIFSTLCNIATDGYYLLVLTREQQAKFAGVLSASSKLAGILFQFIAISGAGWLASHGMAMPGPGIDGHPMPSYLAWGIVLFVVALVYAAGTLVNRRTLPVPPEDVPAEQHEGETARNVGQTLMVVGMAIAGYFAASAIWRLLLDLIATSTPGDHRFAGYIWNFDGWILKGTPGFLSFDVPQLSARFAEWLQLAVCLPLALFGLGAAKRSISGTRTGEAFFSFFRQSKIVPILFFLMFYRFGEAMVVKMAPLFLQDSVAKGGMGLTLEQIGFIKSWVGMAGFISGGLLGGWIVSRYGLRRSFWALAVLMHLPNLLYLWAATTHPSVFAIQCVHFTEQFGYAFGFAGYMIYQMFIAQRGGFRTTHYAIGVGIGALFIQIAFVCSGIIQANFGYQGFFIAAIFAAIPGLLTLLLIPLEDRHAAS